MKAIYLLLQSVIVGVSKMDSVTDSDAWLITTFTSSNS